MIYNRTPKSVEAHKHDASVGYAKWPEWMQKAWDIGKENPHAPGAITPAPGNNRLKINTPFGGDIIEEGDYIVKDRDLIHNQSKEYFEKNFEPAKAPAKKAPAKKAPAKKAAAKKVSAKKDTGS